MVLAEEFGAKRVDIALAHGLVHRDEAADLGKVLTAAAAPAPGRLLAVQALPQRQHAPQAEERRDQHEAAKALPDAPYSFVASAFFHRNTIPFSLPLEGKVARQSRAG